MILRTPYLLFLGEAEDRLAGKPAAAPGVGSLLVGLADRGGGLTASRVPPLARAAELGACLAADLAFGLPCVDPVRGGVGALAVRL